MPASGRRERLLDTYIAHPGGGSTVYTGSAAPTRRTAGFVAWPANAEAMGYTACTKCH
ncbi:MAG: hypothetical protein ACLVL7_01305 [Anaerotruncus massiliensis (ex Togo et al. 2019)]